MKQEDKYDFIARLGKSSILAVFEAASRMLDEEDSIEEEPEVEAAMEACEEDENWEGLPMLEGFDAFEEDPEEYTSGKVIGIPYNQLLVASPYQGMLKPSPSAAMFILPEDD